MSLDLFDAVYIRATRTEIQSLIDINDEVTDLGKKGQPTITLNSSGQTVVYFKIVCKYNYLKFSRRLMNNIEELVIKKAHPKPDGLSI